MNSNNKAMETKRNENAATKLRKEEAISIAQTETENSELKAKENKENADKHDEEIKQKQDDVIKSQKEHLFQKYQLDLQQADHDLKKVDDEYQKELKIIDENFQYLKEKSAQYESDIKSLQKQREESFQKILQFA